MCTISEELERMLKAADDALDDAHAWKNSPTIQRSLSVEADTRRSRDTLEALRADSVDLSDEDKVDGDDSGGGGISDGQYELDEDLTKASERGTSLLNGCDGAVAAPTAAASLPAVSPSLSASLTSGCCMSSGTNVGTSTAGIFLWGSAVRVGADEDVRLVFKHHRDNLLKVVMCKGGGGLVVLSVYLCLFW